MRKQSVILLAMSIWMIVAAAGALAATSNPSPASPGFTPVVLPVMGIYSSNTPALVSFTAPAKYTIVSASVTARGVDGTNPTAKFLIKSGAFTNYSGTLAAAGTAKALTASTNKIIADESTVAVDLVTGGTAPKWRDLTVFILLKRL